MRAQGLRADIPGQSCHQDSLRERTSSHSANDGDFPALYPDTFMRLRAESSLSLSLPVWKGALERPQFACPACVALRVTNTRLRPFELRQLAHTFQN